MLPARHNRTRFTWLRKKTCGAGYVVRGEIGAAGAVRFFHGVPKMPGKIRVSGRKRRVVKKLVMKPPAVVQ